MERQIDVMPTLGFYSYICAQPKATNYCLFKIRYFYPDAPIAISCDDGYDFSDMCKGYGAVYHHYNQSLGYPVQPYGYLKPKIMEWLDRMYRCVLTMKTDYFIMMEDDVLIMAPIRINPEWDMAGQQRLFPGQVPYMPEAFLDIIEKYSGIRPETNDYNTGGGSIFKTSTFVDNYYDVRRFLDEHLARIQLEIYPTIGWLDCMMTVFYLLCGKKINVNYRLYNNYPVVRPFNFSLLPFETDIVHNYKDMYE